MAFHRVNPPTHIKIPDSVEPELKQALEDMLYNMFQGWTRSGGGNDAISELEDRTQFAFSSQAQQTRRELDGLPIFTMDASGFTMDSAEFTMDKRIA